MKDIKMINTLERFYIYKETMLDNQINDKCIVKPNAIIQNNTGREH
jgi:hypothetical protein